MTVQNITAQEAYHWLTTGAALLIDVREPDEFMAEHIPHALSLPLGNVAHSFPLLGLPKGTKIIFQCLRGKRGETACAAVSTLQEAAAYEIYNIEGGLTAWKEAGLPLISSGKSGPKISIFRQVQMIVGALILLLIVLGFSGSPLAFVLAGLLGAAFFMSGLMGWCGLALLLAKAPWNRNH